MSANPASSLPPHGPTRPRATLVPLSDNVSADTAHDQWYLGGNGTVAHRPSPHSGLAQTPPQASRSLAPERSACGVFLTQVPAGPDVPRCPACASPEETHMPPR